MSITYSGTRYLIARKKLSDLRNSTLKTMWDCAKEMGIYDSLKYNQQTNTITINGSEIILRQVELKPSDPEVVELGSIELTAACIDEAGEVEEQIYITLLQRLRYKLSENGLTGKILIVSNPTKNWLYRKFFIPYEQGTLPEGKKYIHCVPSDNPFNDPSYVATLTRENLGDWAYETRVLGNWHYETGDDALFDEHRLMDCFNWNVNGIESKEKFLSVDVATSGEDDCILIYWEGMVAKKLIRLKGKNTIEIADRIKEIIKAHLIPIKNVVIDSVGNGEGVADQLKGCFRFKANNKAFNEESFMMLKDQCYYKLADLVSKGLVRFQFLEERDRTIEELTAHRRHNLDRDQKQKVTPKEQVKLKINRSPDISDALVMRMVYEYQKRELIARSFDFDWKSRRI